MSRLSIVALCAALAVASAAPVAAYTYAAEVTPALDAALPESGAVTPVLGAAQPESGAVSPVTDAALPESAKVSPIAENPIPAWASSSDVCKPSASCDNCAKDSEYCRFSAVGAARCCSAAAGQSVVVPSAAAEEDEESNGAQLFRAVSSLFGSMWGKQTETAAVPSKTAGSVSPVLGESEPESAAVSPVQEAALPESAKVSPITESPIPAWASASDVCIGSTSCDDCDVKGYCRQDASGAANCCVRSQDTALLQPTVMAAKTMTGRTRKASVLPIAENPIPVGASSKDLCRSKRSCDSCSTEQYCRYSMSGKAQCCTLSASAASKASVVPLTTESEAESGTVGVVKDVAMPESGAVSPVAEAQLPESGSIGVIKANPVPVWASAADVCIDSTSCDECDTKGYCKYDAFGATKCCVRQADAAIVQPSVMAAQSKSSVSGSATKASILPITGPAKPQWASASDICLQMTSCDACGASQYCSYAEGKPQCCGRMLATI